MDYYLPVFTGIVALASVLLAPKAESAEAFFPRGKYDRSAVRLDNPHVFSSDHLDICPFADERRDPRFLLWNMGQT